MGNERFAVIKNSHVDSRFTAQRTGQLYVGTKNDF